ncbi:related to tyrosine-protein phosphatase SIW14 [Fusarium torulosum]|uniref:Related to tyrosine-protein phosphatase SIW14 n=1 Tax=Fusarium torulosum TaxID=33205 RepID=A0AAE8M7D3_9HYPO|nr:related to tyrosine-protein phosphatase SIW14 [Fusarium torulosum]
MASKRNSRLFVDEPTHTKEGQQTPNGTQFRSRQGSRSSSRDDMLQEVDAALLNGRDTNRSQGFAAVNMEPSLSASSSRTSDSSASSISAYQSPSSELIAPLNGRPHNFGIVVPGVYRSSFPRSHDFEYIKGLGLKTIVTLVKKEELDHDLETFVSREGIRQVVFNMKGTKKEAIPLSTMKAILSIVLDKSNYPLLIHCNHGKHRTGCVVGVVRKVAGWDAESVVAEYKSYAEPKAREVDVTYLDDFQVSSLVISNTNTPKDICTKCGRMQPRTFFRAVIFSTCVLLLWFLSGSRISTATRPDHLLP